MSAKEDILRHAELHLQDYLDAHGKRYTQERVMLLRSIVEIGSPFTIKQLLQQAYAQYISRGTVYNTLQILIEARIIQPAHKSYEGNDSAFEMVQFSKNQMHIICPKCGRVSPFKDIAIENLIKRKKYNNFNMQHFTLYIYGECKLCRKNIAKGITIKNKS